MAVDGWALTMLSPEMAEWGGTCNTIGQNFGYFLAFSGFWSLESLGLISLRNFIRIWSFLFIFFTLIVAIFKKEANHAPENRKENKLKAIKSTYKQMFKILTLKPIKLLLVFLLFSKLPFAITDNVTGLKFQENGVSMETMSSFSTFAIPIGILLPPFISAKIITKGWRFEISNMKSFTKFFFYS